MRQIGHLLFDLRRDCCL